MQSEVKYYDEAAVMEYAAEMGTDQNPLFIQAAKNYRTLQEAIAACEEAIREEAVVEKTYVKDRPNLACNPCLVQLPKLTDSAGKVLQTMLQIIDAQKKADPSVNLLKWVEEH